MVYFVRFHFNEVFLWCGIAIMGNIGQVDIIEYVPHDDDDVCFVVAGDLWLGGILLW